MEAADAQREQAAAAEELGRQEAAMIEDESREEVRRAREEAADIESESRARAGASGVSSGGLYAGIDDMAEEHDRQIAWMEKAGESRARLAIQGGQNAAAIGRANAEASLAGGIGAGLAGAADTYSLGSQANWWT
jgi:hypothetical protein